ncbi:helix-turn-helix transcriptional regulator [uncultured Draconibacterium sp.]|uniref:helix-turn-helix domain-containing protein n=1 Tax=uncultured Draconibacterium sp. TaxID=1573823 RepID=UPI0025CEABFC|nr:helix-turn-helix transcriptional regulator [uncultured Draconibacterium sp.]
MKTVSHDEELKTVLAQQFKELRLKNKLTQSQLADRLGVEKGQVSRIENGRYNLTLASIDKIAAALGARVSFELQPN